MPWPPSAEATSWPVSTWPTSTPIRSRSSPAGCRTPWPPSSSSRTRWSLLPPTRSDVLGRAPCCSRAPTSEASPSTPTTGRRRASTWRTTRRRRCASHGSSLERQVIVTGAGRSARLRQETAAYFTSRPHGSRLGALTSRQSEVIDSREVLIRALRRARRAVPRGFGDPGPRDLGRLPVVPDEVEFWQGRPNRLHDRVRTAARRWLGDRAVVAQRRTSRRTSSVP